MANIVEFPKELEEVPGARELYQWYGYWPHFHDAEVVSLHLNRRGSSSLTVHAWQITKEVDEHGYFIEEKHVVVTFKMDNVIGLDLEEFNHQNVLYDLQLRRTDSGFEMELNSTYGLGGTLVADRVSVTFAPGEPEPPTPGKPTHGRARMLTDEEKRGLEPV